MARKSDAQTRAEHVYGRLRHDILNRVWIPGQRLLPIELMQHYEASSTVIREVLLRLLSERLAQQNETSKAYFVRTLSVDDVKDLTLVRIQIDELALRLAIERGDLAWETEILAKHHVLSRTRPRSEEDPLHTTEDWSTAHKAFHAALIAACGVPLLCDISNTIFDATELYRRWGAPSSDTVKRDVAKEHEAIVNAVIARDTETATRLIAQHYSSSLQVITSNGFTLPESTHPYFD